MANLSRLVKITAKLKAKNPSWGGFLRIGNFCDEAHDKRTSGLYHDCSFRIAKKNILNVDRRKFAPGHAISVINYRFANIDILELNVMYKVFIK